MRCIYIQLIVNGVNASGGEVLEDTLSPAVNHQRLNPYLAGCSSDLPRIEIFEAENYERGH